MRKVILFVLLFTQVMGYAQNRKVLNILDSTSTIFRCNRDNNVKVSMFGEDIKYRKFINLIKLDVCQYNNLESYDTELKKKVFKESAEGQKLLKSMKVLKQKVMTLKSYYIFNFDDNKGWHIGYNIQKKQFVFTYTVEESDYLYASGYNTFSSALIKMNPLIRQVKENREGFTLLDIRLPLVNEKTALAMEENLENLALIVEFKI